LRTVLLNWALKEKRKAESGNAAVTRGKVTGGKVSRSDPNAKRKLPFGCAAPCLRASLAGFGGNGMGLAKSLVRSSLAVWRVAARAGGSPGNVGRSGKTGREFPASFPRVSGSGYEEGVRVLRVKKTPLEEVGNFLGVTGSVGPEIGSVPRSISGAEMKVGTFPRSISGVEMEVGTVTKAVFESQRSLERFRGPSPERK
jgi:hypothetical protein